MSTDETTEPEALPVDQRRSVINARPEIEDIARIIGGHTALPISKRLAIARSIAGNGYAMQEDQGPTARAHRPAQTEPTAEEREALSNFLFSVYEHGSQPNALREADAILSFLASRRPAQAEPTDAQAIAARDELQRHGYARASLFAMRAALKAAFTAGQEKS